MVKFRTGPFWGMVVMVMVLFLGISVSFFPQGNQGDSLAHRGEALDFAGVEMDASDLGLFRGYIPYVPSPYPFTLTQPDNTQFAARMAGDVLGGHHETLEGYSIVLDSSGWWTYAVLDERGLLVPSEHIVGKINPEDIAVLKKHLGNEPLIVNTTDSHDLTRNTRSPPITGLTTAIAIMLNFTNEDFDAGNNRAHFEQLLNGTTGNTMRTYYREVSYNQFDIEVDVVGPFKSSKTMEWYGEDGTGRDNKNGPIYEMAREAVNLADASGVNFTKYDMDGDNTIDALFIIHAGSGQEDGGSASEIWSHQGLIFPAESTDDGIFANVYSTEPEDGKVGVFAHEFGHVMDLPDLYDADYGGSGGWSNGIGDWGLMGSGSWNGGGNSPAHLCAWSKIQVGWVEPIVVTSDISLSNIEIPPVENYPVVYKLWAHEPSQNTSEYFLVENRQKLGFDSQLPGEGILIWHIDDSVGDIAWNDVNDNPNHLRVDLEEAHGGTQDLKTRANSGDANDPWKSSVGGFNDTSDPKSASYNNSQTGVWVWNISAIFPDDNMTVGFNEINTGPAGIYIVDPTSSVLIDPVYDFVLNDTGFPDEDVATFPGNLKIQHSWPGMNSWIDTPFQTLITWTAGVGGIINCTGLPNGTWDFRVKATDEEGHVWYTQVLINVMILDLAPPIADAGADFLVGTDLPAVLNGSNSFDDSGFIAWYNWTFGDGEFLKGFGPANATVIHLYSTPGVYNVTLNVSDAQGNWAVDWVEVTVFDATPPVTNLTMGVPRFRVNVSHDWNITSNTPFSLSSYDKFSGVSKVWYKIDADYLQYAAPFDLMGYPEGAHMITWGAEDGAGNNASGETMVVWVDASAPFTTYNIGEPRHPWAMVDGVNMTSSTSIDLLPVDAPAHASGIALTWYYIDSDYFEGDSFTLSGHGEGAHIIKAGSIDNLGHNATGNQITIWVDDSPPQTGMIINEPRHPDTPLFGCNVSNATQFDLVAVDQPGHSSGINFTWYFIDDDYYVGTTFNLVGYDEGLHNITWGSVDNLYHNESANRVTVIKDDSPPVTQALVWQPKYPLAASDGANVTSNTQITLVSTDQPLGYSAGVEFSWYTIDGALRSGSSFNLSGYGEGPHAITWGSEDHLGHNESGNIMTLWVDDTPPETVLTIEPPKFPDNNDQGCNVTPYAEFLFSAVDYPAHNASVWYEWYTINGIWYKGNNFSFSDFGFDEGRYNITFGSLDWLGNNETANTMWVFLDRRPPVCELEISGPMFRDYGYEILNISDTTSFFLNVSDQYSGVEKVWYIIDGAYFEGTNFSLISYPEGVHTITYGAQDNLGQNKTQATLQLMIDRMPPSANMTVGTPTFRESPGDPWIVTDQTMFFIEAQDDMVGVDEIWYIINGTYFEENYDTVFFFILGDLSEGLQDIIWGTKDRLSNNMTGAAISVFLDIEPPVTNISFEGPSFRKSEGDLWKVSSQTMFRLQGADGISGLNFTWYTIDGKYFVGDEFTLDAGVFGDGEHTITWGSMDRIGHNETGNSMRVVLDNTPPVTDIAVDGPKSRNYALDAWNVTADTRFNLTSLDTYSEVVRVWYMIDGNYFEGDSFTLIGLAEGLYVIEWGGIDSLGNNESQNKIEIILDLSPPDTQLDIGEPRYRGQQAHAWNVSSATEFTLISVDGLSGVATLWYTIDDHYYVGSDFRLTGRLDGPHEISWGAEDNLGNEMTGGTILVNLDTSAPMTEITIGDKKPNISQKFTLNSSTYVTLAAEDGFGSGVDFIWYSLDGGTTFLVYKNPFKVPNGTTTIRFGAEDRLGINATQLTLRVVVDDTNPDDEPDGADGGDEGEKPFAEELANMLLDYYWIILMVLVVLIVIVALLKTRRKKEKKEEVLPQTQGTVEVVEGEIVEEAPPEAPFQPIQHYSPPPPPPPYAPPPPPP